MRRIITTGARSAAHRRTVGGVLLVLVLSSWATTAAAAGLDIGEHFAFSPRDPTRSPAANSLRVRGALALRTRVEGHAIPREISGLAYSSDDTRLAIARLARCSSAEGWPVDNFEAIAVHRARHYFIASDDNEHPLQRALLIYLEWPADE